MAKRFLIIDDDELFCNAVALDFCRDMSVYIAHSGKEGVEFCRKFQMGVVLLDQKLPDGDGVDFCADILAANKQCKIIFTTAYPTFENAVDAIKFGAHDYLSKPLHLNEIRLAVDKAFRTLDLEQLEQVQKFENRRLIKKTKLVGHLPETRQLAKLASQNSAPVLVTGETGVGKSLLARMIHYGSPQKNAPFISLNCATLPENLVEAELFGAEKGAYTGSVSRKHGIFEMAGKGTLFLDEIGEIPMHLQGKLLGVLDERLIRRVGGRSPIPVNARIIAATNRNIEDAMEKKQFRQDLYYRLSVLRIHVPPLRERIEDIPELCRFFLEQIAPHAIAEISQDEIRRLQNYGWPGNVRELKNVLERAAILGDNGEFKPSRLLEINPPSPTRATCPPYFNPTPNNSHDQPFDIDSIPNLKVVEDAHIRFALNALDNNYTQCAKVLGISRSTLKRKLKNL